MFVRTQNACGWVSTVDQQAVGNANSEEEKCVQVGRRKSVSFAVAQQ